MTTLIFLAVAAVIFWRLRSVLGTRTGNERPPHDPFQTRTRGDSVEAGSDAKPADNVIRLPSKDPVANAQSSEETHPDLIDDEVKNPWAGYAEEGSEMAASFQALRDADGQFHPRDFLDGARLAYEMIVLSFASGDKETLKPLLDGKVYDSFSEVIDDRKSRGEKTEMTFIGVVSSKIKEAEIDDGDAHVTVRFVSELISVTYNDDHAVVDGDPNQVSEVTDIWTFTRSVSADDPNWVLTVTKSE